MDEQRKQEALEDIKLIKAIIKGVGWETERSGIFSILFGICWLIATLVWYFPGASRFAHRVPQIFIPLWIGFVLAITIFLLLWGNRLKKKGLQDGPPTQLKGKVSEITGFSVAVCFLSSFVGNRLNLWPEGQGLLTPFVLLLVMGMMYYFIGVAWVAEFRFPGVLAFVGMIIMTYAKGYEILILNLTLGLMAILVGCLLQRRWLKAKRREVSPTREHAGLIP